MGHAYTYQNSDLFYIYRARDSLYCYSIRTAMGVHGRCTGTTAKTASQEERLLQAKVTGKF